jgi:hypothetical protein
MSLDKWLVQDGESKVIDLALVRSVKVGLLAGEIDVIAHDEPGARVEVHSVHGRPLKVSLEGERLEIDHAQMRWDSVLDLVTRFGRSGDRAEVSLLVPRDVALTFGTVSASGLVSGLVGDAKITTVGGDIVVDGLVGDLEANTVNGELSVRNHRGRISARTVSGDVTVGGDISRLSVDGVSGNVFVDAEGTPDEIRANSISGDLTVRVDEGLGARFRINTATGKLQIDGSAVRGAFGRGYSATSGTLDRKWVDVIASSVSGDVTVLRREVGAATAADASTGTSPEDPSDGTDWGTPGEPDQPTEPTRPTDGGAL